MRVVRLFFLDLGFALPNDNFFFKISIVSISVIEFLFCNTCFGGSLPLLDIHFFCFYFYENARWEWNTWIHLFCKSESEKSGLKKNWDYDKTSHLCAWLISWGILEAVHWITLQFNMSLGIPWVRYALFLLEILSPPEF